MERGTLYQLRNLINRRNVKKEVKSDVNAAEDFIEIVVTGYIVSAVLSYLGMSSITDAPNDTILSPDLWMEDDSVRKSALIDVASAIVDKHIDLSTDLGQMHEESDNGSAENSDDCGESVVDDGGEGSGGQDGPVGSAYEYCREVLSLGLLYLYFKDSIREGDGTRVMVAWKYFMLIFKATKHKNYALEALTMLTQYFVILPPNLAEQLKWSRFVNVHGFPGHNISADLHMEHMNRTVKTIIDGLGSNKTDAAIVRAGKSVGPVSDILTKFDDEAGVAPISGKHADKSELNDLHQIVNQLMEVKVFDAGLHDYKSYLNLKANLSKSLSKNDLRKWILNNFSKHTLF